MNGSTIENLCAALEYIGFWCMGRSGMGVGVTCTRCTIEHGGIPSIHIGTSEVLVVVWCAVYTAFWTGMRGDVVLIPCRDVPMMCVWTSHAATNKYERICDTVEICNLSFTSYYEAFLSHKPLPQSSTLRLDFLSACAQTLSRMRPTY